MEEPAILFPFASLRIQAHDQIHLTIEVMDGDPLERTGARVEQPEIVNALLSAVPDLILFEASQLLEARSTKTSEIYSIQGEFLKDIPIVRWKLLATYEKRMRAAVTTF